MSSRPLKFGYYTLEAATSFAATFYLNYIFFLTHRTFAFTDRDNLLLTALHGGVYVVSSWLGGKFIQRVGCFTALKLGFAGMAIGLALGLGTTPPANPIDTLMARPQRTIILIDTSEALAQLENWLRDAFLPQLPANALVIFAGRNPPAATWRADPGWQSLLQIFSLPRAAHALFRWTCTLARFKVFSTSLSTTCMQCRFLDLLGRRSDSSLSWDL